jgi:circadian clock protein KaiB
MSSLKKIKPTTKRSKSTGNKNVRKKYLLRLYVVGQTPNCKEAYKNLKKICDEYIPNVYVIEIIDLLKFPNLAKSEKIIAIPTVIKKLPAPIRRIIGNLSSTEKVLVGIDLQSKR